MKKGRIVGALVWGFAFLCVGLGSLHAEGEGLDVLGHLPLWSSPDTVGVRALGMGNAGVAVAEGTSGLFLNPAGLRRRQKAYILDASFSFHPAADSRIWNVSLVDSKSNPLLGGGMSYSYFWNPREGDGKTNVIQGHVVRLGAAMTWREQFFIGLTLKYLHLTRPFVPVISSFNLDVGVIWQFHRWFALSAVGYNLVYHESGEIPISMALGLAFGGALPVKVVLDWVIDFQTKGEVGHELRAGVQYTFLKYFTLRCGYQLDQVRDRRPVLPWLPTAQSDLSHHLSVGLGLRYAKVGLQVAFRQQLALDTLSQNRYLGFAFQLWL